MPNKDPMQAPANTLNKSGEHDLMPSASDSPEIIKHTTPTYQQMQQTSQAARAEYANHPNTLFTQPAKTGDKKLDSARAYGMYVNL